MPGATTWICHNNNSAREKTTASEHNRQSLPSTAIVCVNLHPELRVAADFLGRLHSSAKVPADQIKTFKLTLHAKLVDRYSGHWHPSRPHKGSAYRALECVGSKLDPALEAAAQKSGVTLRGVLPSHFTMWIDPNEVAVRFGEDGSICELEMSNGSEKSVVRNAGPSMPPLVPGAESIAVTA